MERTYILGNGESLKQLDGTFIEIPPFNTNEESKIHDWIVQLFRDTKIEKIVIEVDNNPNLSLQIGLHIRLSIEDLREKALVPILFLSQLTLNSVIQQTEVNSHIFATKGVMFSEFNISENRKELDILRGLQENEYLTGFLKRIHIQPDESIGRHSLANIWGAYALDKAANTNALPSSSDFQKRLYFKYVNAFNDLHKLKSAGVKVLGKIHFGKTSRIESSGKRILFIDDEADKGWETVLREVFKTNSTSDFVVICEKVEDYKSLSEESRNLIEKEKFDLYLIDLRLNGLEEDDNTDTQDFSGMKVLNRIKEINEGNQVIIFSASNKVWNLKSLFDAKADGYYLKESPEFKFANLTTEKNYKEFKETAEKCLERGYLRILFTFWKNAIDQKGTSHLSFINESETSLKLAWELLKREYLDFGFFTLYQIIENYANQLYTQHEFQDTFEGEMVIDKSDLDQHEWFMTINKDYQNGFYFSSGKELQNTSESPTTIFKVSCLFKVKFSVEDDFLKRIGYLNKKRNEIAHHGSQGFITVDNLLEILNIIAVTRNGSSSAVSKIMKKR